VDHYPVADLRLAGSHGVTDELDDPTRLMAFDDQFIPGAPWSVKMVEIAAAHTGRLHPDNHFIRTWHQIRILADLELTVPQKNDCPHIGDSWLDCWRR
jgi:hypothetical protein